MGKVKNNIRQPKVNKLVLLILFTVSYFSFLFQKNLATIHIPTTEELDYFKDKSTSKSTKQATTNWINCLEKFREQAGYCGKVEEVDNLKILEEQLSSFIVGMRTKNGSEYKAASVNAAIAAIKRHLDSNSGQSVRYEPIWLNISILLFDHHTLLYAIVLTA